MRRGRHGLQDRLKLHHRHIACLGQWHQTQLGLQGHPQGAFRADQHLGHIERLAVFYKPVQVIATYPPHDFRIAFINFRRVLRCQLRHHPVALALQVILLGLGRPRRSAQGSHLNNATVGQHHGQFLDIVDSHAVHDRARAGGIIGDHAANHRPVGSRNIQRQIQTMRSELGIEIVQHNPWLQPDVLLGLIHLQDAIDIFGKIELNPLADRLASLRGAATARGDGDAVLAAELQRAANVLTGARNDHP